MTTNLKNRMEGMRSYSEYRMNMAKVVLVDGFPSTKSFFRKVSEFWFVDGATLILSKDQPRMITEEV